MLRPRTGRGQTGGSRPTAGVGVRGPFQPEPFRDSVTEHRNAFLQMHPIYSLYLSLQAVSHHRCPRTGARPAQRCVPAQCPPLRVRERHLPARAVTNSALLPSVVASSRKPGGRPGLLADPRPECRRSSGPAEHRTAFPTGSRGAVGKRGGRAGTLPVPAPGGGRCRHQLIFGVQHAPPSPLPAVPWRRCGSVLL